jgi:hypothetical protein
MHYLQHKHERALPRSLHIRGYNFFPAPLLRFSLSLSFSIFLYASRLGVSPILAHTVLHILMSPVQGKAIVT